MSFDVVLYGGPVYGPGASPYPEGDIGRVQWGRETKIVTVSGNGSSYFSSLADSLNHGDGILANILKQHGIDLAEVDQIALAGFSAFHGLANKILATEPEKVTAVVLLDSCFGAAGAPRKAGYVAFGERAARGEALMVYTASAGQNSTTGGLPASTTGDECATANFNEAASNAGVTPQPYTPPDPVPPPGIGERAGDLILLDYGAAHLHDWHVNHNSVAVLQTFLAPYLAGERTTPGGAPIGRNFGLPIVVGLGVAIGLGVAAAMLLSKRGRATNPQPHSLDAPALVPSILPSLSDFDRSDGESVLVKGDQITLFRGDDELRLPRSYKLVHDTRGDFFSTDDVLLVPATTASGAVGSRSRGVRSTHGRRIRRSADARNYFGKGAHLVPKGVDLPRGPWSRFGSVDAIWYRRAYLGELVPFEHPYERPVPLYRCGSVFKLRLPPGAVYDERGFVWP